MKRGKALKPGNPMKRGRRKPRPSLQGFWEAVTANGTNPCVLAHLGGCAGPLDAHHYVPKQRFRWLICGDAMVHDPRNGVPLCRQHHAQVENARVECPRPPDLDGFLADYGLYERERAA